MEIAFSVHFTVGSLTVKMVNAFRFRIQIRVSHTIVNLSTRGLRSNNIITIAYSCPQQF